MRPGWGVFFALVFLLASLRSFTSSFHEPVSPAALLRCALVSSRSCYRSLEAVSVDVAGVVYRVPAWLLAACGSLSPLYSSYSGWRGRWIISGSTGCKLTALYFWDVTFTSLLCRGAQSSRLACALRPLLLSSSFLYPPASNCHFRRLVPLVQTA